MEVKQSEKNKTTSGGSGVLEKSIQQTFRQLVSLAIVLAVIFGLWMLFAGCTSGDFHARMTVTEPMALETEVGDDRPGLIYGGIQSTANLPSGVYIGVSNTKEADGSGPIGGPLSVSPVQITFAVKRVGIITHDSFTFRDLRIGMGFCRADGDIDWTVPSLVLLHGHCRDTGLVVEASIDGPLVERLYRMRLASQD